MTHRNAARDSLASLGIMHKLTLTTIQEASSKEGLTTNLLDIHSALAVCPDQVRPGPAFHRRYLDNHHPRVHERMTDRTALT